MYFLFFKTSFQLFQPMRSSCLKNYFHLIYIGIFLSHRFQIECYLISNLYDVFKSLSSVHMANVSFNTFRLYVVYRLQTNNNNYYISIEIKNQ